MSEKDSKFPVEADGQMLTKMKQRPGMNRLTDAEILRDDDGENVSLVTISVKHSASDPFYQPGEHIYKMTSVPRGLCLVINNMDFNYGPTKDPLMGPRRGSNVDAFRIEHLFERLNFAVIRHRNLKANVSRISS